MKFNKNTAGKSVFRDETILTGTDVDEPVLRDDKIQKIADSLRPLVRGNRSENLLVHGDSGVGKSTCVSYVLDELDRQTRVETTTINCWHYNTRISLLTQLLIDLGYPAPRKGKPVDELVAKLREWLDKNKSVAVVLDEFDQLDEQNEVVYDLYQLTQETENVVGVTMVSNKHPSEIELDSRSQSRSNYETLEFEPYTQKELKEILEDRAEKAFRNGAYEDEVIKKAVEEAVENEGDCRRALEVLLRAGRKADEEGSRTVEAKYV